MSNSNYSIYKGDDTDAFGGSFLTINATIPTGYTVSKAEIKIGILEPIEIDNPVFPLQISLSSGQTTLLMNKNNIHMAVYDEEGRKATCKGVITFNAKEQVV